MEQKKKGFLADAERALEDCSSCSARDVIVSEARAGEHNRSIVVYTSMLRDGHFRGWGQIFRALECIELQLTLRMIDLLTQHSIVSSVIWLHGNWISPPSNTQLVQTVDQLICQEFIYTGQPLFMIKDLAPSHAALVSQLPTRRQRLPRRGKAPLLGSLTHSITITRTSSRSTYSEASTFYSRLEDHETNWPISLRSLPPLPSSVVFCSGLALFSHTTRCRRLSFRGCLVVLLSSLVLFLLPLTPLLLFYICGVCLNCGRLYDLGKMYRGHVVWVDKLSRFASQCSLILSYLQLA